MHTRAVTHTVAQGINEDSEVDPLEPRAPFVVDRSSRYRSVPYVDCEDHVPAFFMLILGALKEEVGRSSFNDDCSAVANIVKET